LTVHQTLPPFQNFMDEILGKTTVIQSHDEWLFLADMGEVQEMG